METIILLVHMLAAAGVIVLIMLQQGKGAETGASFGSGASQTVFGSQGSANFLSRTTAILATIFFLTSIGLAVVARQKADTIVEAGLPTIAVEEPVMSQNDAPLTTAVETVETANAAKDAVETVEVVKNATEAEAPVLESAPAEGENTAKSAE